MIEDDEGERRGGAGRGATPTRPRRPLLRPRAGAVLGACPTATTAGQGLSSTATLTFEAEQTANNP